MTDGHARGAPGGPENAHRALRDLVMAATVRIHRAGAGYALEEPGTFLGSGFFIAPNWVLTCAHVARSGEGGEVTVVYETGPGRGTSAVAGEVATALPEAFPQHLERAVRGSWPAPDLALVQLREPVDHDCAYITERPAAYYGEATVLYSGWSVVGGELRRLIGTCSVQGTLGGWSTDEQIRLGGDVLPPGVSGGPVVDPVRGEVVGVLKSQADRGLGGTSTGVEQLRSLPVPAGAVRAEHDDPYTAVFHAHDRYHRDRQRHPDSDRSTWADVQGQLGARPGRALSPDERTQLLGRLADLPPPASTRALLGLLESLLGSQASIPHPAPRGWRDGLGALYETSRQDGALELVLDYAMRVMSAERPFVTPGTQSAERALWEWVRQAAEGLGLRYRRDLAQRRIELLRVPPRSQEPPPRLQELPRLPPGPERYGVVDVVHDAPGGRPAVREPAEAVPTAESTAVPTAVSTHAADRAPRLFALLELVQRGWEPDRCDWRVSVARPTGEVVRLHEGERTPLAELPGTLAASLAEAFRRCDEPGRPAVLQVALPHLLLDLDVDAWQLHPDEPPLGAHRPVVVRCADREQLPDGEDSAAFGGKQALSYGAHEGEYGAHGEYDGERGQEHGEERDGEYGGERGAEHEEHLEREARWRWIHAYGAEAEVLDCEDGLRVPVPPAQSLRGLPHRTVPVLCRYGDQRFEDDPVALVRIVHGGFGVALWRRWRGQSDAVCGEFHRRAGDTVAGAGSAERLPELVRALRAGVRAGRAETYWADGIALFYDDPRRPLPGTGDLLEAP
ncbi:trypsin-like peptidase domain-containing protein [Streptomyces sp. NPDC048275]|uniref:VMAP-C domain-containing protein n=1 Tax=Streptomyces sp. NPDC048275 TaxID=3155629 RepID=UPI0033D91D14